MVTGRKNCEAVKYAIHFIEDNLFSRPINALTDFTFGQYHEVIFSGANWPRFEAVFDLPKEILNMDFEKINDLRNIVFHFRRGITHRDTDRFRDKLRYNRDLYNAKK